MLSASDCVAGELATFTVQLSSPSSSLLFSSPCNGSRDNSGEGEGGEDDEDDFMFEEIKKKKTFQM